MAPIYPSTLCPLELRVLALTHPTPDHCRRQTRPSGAIPFAALRDALGYRVSGASPGALDAYERALAAWQGWHIGAEAPLAAALQDAPQFVMAHLLQAYLLLCSRDSLRVASTRPVLARAARLPANERERIHMEAIRAVLDDDYERARNTLGHLLRRYPRDVLALQVAHVFDYVTGETLAMHARLAAVLPAWSAGMPGYHAVLAMHAFSLAECGFYEQAAETAGALAQDRSDARACHVMAHLFEMTERPDNTLAITLLASLPALAHRLGGSHAQRDVLNLTLLRAVERVRRPAGRRLSMAQAGTDVR
jgi:Tfp pilus assembly protein PilF